MIKEMCWNFLEMAAQYLFLFNVNSIHKLAVPSVGPISGEVRPKSRECHKSRKMKCRSSEKWGYFFFFDFLITLDTYEKKALATFFWNRRWFFFFILSQKNTFCKNAHRFSFHVQRVCVMRSILIFSALLRGAQKCFFFHFFEHVSFKIFDGTPFIFPSANRGGGKKEEKERERQR